VKGKLAKGVVWLGGAKILVNILSLSSTLVLARLLTPEDFGLVAIATTLLAIIAAMTELSLAAALIHHKEPTEAHFHAAWTLNVLRATFIGAVFGASGPLVADFYRDPRLTGIMVTLGISVALSGFGNPKITVRTRNLEFWQEFVVAVTQKLLAFAVGLILALVYRSYWALLGATLAGQVGAVVVSYFIYPYRPRFSVKNVKDLWSFSMWLTLGQAIKTLNWKLDHLLVGTYLGQQALGTYTVGDNLAGMATRETTGPIQQTLFPGLRSVAHDPVQLRRTYQRAQALISAIALPAGFCCAVLAEPLVRLILGPKWIGAVLIVQVLGCVFALQTISSTAQPLALAKGETRLLFRRDLLNFLVRVPIVVTGMLLAGLTGIVFARMLSSLIGGSVEMKLVERLIGLSLTQQLRNSVRSLVSVSLMSLTMLGATQLLSAGDGWLRQTLHLFAMAGIGIAIYAASHFSMWRLMGRPVGPETDFLSMVEKLRDKLRS